MASGKTPSKAGISGTTATTASSTKNGGNSLETEKKEKWRREERGSKRVRLLHVSRPLVGGLIGVPESAGGLDTTTVEKYAAVFKLYQGTRFQAVHDGVVFFFSFLVSALVLKLALGWNRRKRLGRGET